MGKLKLPWKLEASLEKMRVRLRELFERSDPKK